MEPYEPASVQGSPSAGQQMFPGFEAGAENLSGDESNVVTHIPREPRRISILSVMLVCSLGLFFLTYFVPYFVENIQYAVTRGHQRAEYEAAGEHLPSASLVALSGASQLISQRIGPAVVHINTSRTRSVDKDDSGLQLLDPKAQDEMQGEGSGVIVDTGGYIITNYHVIRGTERIDVRLSDGRTIEAVVFGVDKLTDLALLKIEADKLIAAEWGNSDELKVGGLVWAIGSPFGLEHSITFGILSAKNRRGFAGSTYQDFLQTDAAVNPGNSGGPLVDSNGRLVGINTAIVGHTYQGISFAIPSSVVHHVYTQLRTNKYVSRGWLGVELVAISRQRQEELGLTSTRGAYVRQVVGQRLKRSPAAVAGLENGDVILRWDGEEIETPPMLSRLVAETEIGKEVEVIVFRDGKEINLPVKVDERPKQFN